MEQIMRMINDMAHPTIEDKKTLATYYAPLFPPTERTVDFLTHFAECFGNHSSFCNSMPRPLLCKQCTDKYIHQTQAIVDYTKINHIDLLPTYQKILQRFEDLQEQITLVSEHLRVDHDVNTDTLFDFLGIDMDHYDPPSTSVMDKCENYPFVKQSDEVTCSICLCDIEEQEQVKKLICKHVYHEGCIMGWLKNNSTCPVCKTSLKNETEDESKEVVAHNFLDTLLPHEEEEDQYNPFDDMINQITVTYRRNNGYEETVNYFVPSDDSDHSDDDMPRLEECCGRCGCLLDDCECDNDDDETDDEVENND